MHGARGGAPCGPRNGAWRHGEQSKAAEAERAELAALLAEAQELADSICDGRLVFAGSD